VRRDDGQHEHADAQETQVVGAEQMDADRAEDDREGAMAPAASSATHQRSRSLYERRRAFGCFVAVTGHRGRDDQHQQPLRS
jgi:hypothetical protein